MNLNPLKNNIFRGIAMSLVIISTTAGLAQSAESAKRKVRFIGASNLVKLQQVVLASRDSEGIWHELGDVNLKNSQISDWVPAQTGELHLAVKKDGAHESLCRFSYAEDSGPGLVVLLEKPDEKTCEAHFVDPKKTKFEKGTLLIFNLGIRAGIVSYGSAEDKVEAGKQMVIKPVPDSEGMIHMRVSQVDDKGNPKPCFDRYLSDSPNSHRIMFLLADATVGIRVVLSSIHGKLD
jgi:hypothetical protein